MQNMWSENKILNNLINILIFLLAINFLHYGQLFLPVICVLIFIGNNFKIIINNKTLFIIICLFAISFFVFSYDYGFYSTIGFCLPMAYYIGSNVKANNNNIKKLIYLIAFGMASHLILNCIFDNYYYLKTEGVLSISRFNHYDIWLLDKISPTGIATNYPIIIACLYYLLFYEENNKVKKAGILISTLAFLYNLILGRRTSFFILVICFFASCIFDVLLNNKRKKIFIITFICFVLFVALILIVYTFNIFGLRYYLHTLRLVQKFEEYGLDSGRIELLIKAIKLMPYHLWGKQEISSIIDGQIHDLWTDVYDFAGVVPYLFLIMCTVLMAIGSYKTIVKNKKNNPGYSLLYLSFGMCSVMEMMIEPIMTGASLFMICAVIIFSAIVNAKDEA